MINDFRHYWLPDYKQRQQPRGGGKGAKSMPFPKFVPGTDIPALAELLTERLLENSLTGHPRKPGTEKPKRVAKIAGFAS